MVSSRMSLRTATGWGLALAGAGGLAAQEPASPANVTFQWT
jgi:hypothetical protein